MRNAVSTRKLLTWEELARRAGAGLAALLAVAAIGLKDLESAAMAAGVLISLGIARRWRIGLVGLALLEANVTFWMAPGAISNVTHGENFWATALPSALTVVAVTSAIASVAVLRFRGARMRDVRGVALTALAVLAVLLFVSSVGVGSRTQAKSGDIQLVAEHMKFSSTKLSAKTGDVGVYISNKDLFWHTFTVKGLDVNVNVPVGGHRRVEFAAGRGTYEFLCMIPGHAQAGMKGTLTVRDD